MKTDDFDFYLPEELIAQTPLKKRDSSKLLVLDKKTGLTLLCIVWSFALAGILFKAFWVNCPKWISSVLYIGMGWTCVLTFSQLLNSMSPYAFLLLLIGGIIYTAGGVIYALKIPIFKLTFKYFGNYANKTLYQNEQFLYGVLWKEKFNKSERK